MKRLFMIVSLTVFFSILLAACAPKIVPTSSAQVTNAAPINTATLVPMSTATGSAPEPAALAKPEVTLGATFRYIDGTLLEAIPAGPFTMGRKGGSNNPEHTVTLSDFWIYSTKVTNRQYTRCVNAAQCTPADVTGDLSQFDNPVTGVDWDQAQAYCSYVFGRLPTEAEWEKAARGPNGNIYPWGNDQQPSCDLLNFNASCVGTTTNVTAYPQGQSYYHVLDMDGNTYEWVADWYEDTYYRNSPSNDPQGPNGGSERVIRGSGYRSTIDSTLASVRSSFTPDKSDSDLGFRCVVDDPTVAAPSCEQISTYGPPPSNNAQSVHKNVPTICPKVGITVGMQLCGSTYVTFTSDIPGQTTISGMDNCTQLLGTLDSYPQTYDCHADTTATISGACTYSGIGNAYCGIHYKLDPTTGTCKWDGSSGLGSQCLTGTNYDSANNCCSATLGGKDTYPLCEVGTTLVDFGNSKYGCVTISSLKTAASISEDVVMPAACK